TQRLGAASQLLAVDSPREGLVLHLLAHGSRVDRRQRAVWLHKGARDDEAAHLVHGIEGFADRGVARNAQAFGVRGDVAQSILWPAPLTEHRDAAVGVLLGGGTALVVPVVDEAEHAPALLALTEAAGVRSHSRLDAAHVAAQVLALRHLGDQGPGFLALRRVSLHAQDITSRSASSSRSCCSRVPMETRSHPATGGRS